MPSIGFEKTLQGFKKTLFGSSVNTTVFVIGLGRHRCARSQQKLDEVEAAFSRRPKQRGVSVPSPYIGTSSCIE